jgi:hypothetical protein
MQVPYDEGVANHIGSESCGDARKDMAEALTGENAGRAIEPRKESNFRVPTAYGRTEGNTNWIAIARASWTRRGRRTLARMEALYTETGRSWFQPCRMVAGYAL